MAQRSFPEDMKKFFCGTDNEASWLLYPLRESIQCAKRIDLIVSFVMESGIRLILEPLKQAADRGCSIRIVCGSYLGITEPTALAILLNELKDLAQIRFYQEARRSFHPKSYLFEYPDGRKEAFIGSSNLSRSALTSAIEWNCRIDSAGDPAVIESMHREFDRLFQKADLLDQELLSSYAKNWIRPKISRNCFPDQNPALGTQPVQNPDLLKILNREAEIPDSPVLYPSGTVSPRGAQIEALYALKNTRENGNHRAMVQAATGIGKTYLAAFDSRPFQKILFIAHRKEILDQAVRSFRMVRPESSIGLLDKDHHDLHCDIVMASVATISKAEYLNSDVLAPDAFDYIVIDEFHHAAADSYRRIIDYFKPRFLLGLTATPDRMDGRSVYALCDFNVPYAIDLNSAINRGLLVPFHYYAVYDRVDYSQMRLVRGRYQTGDLEAAYLDNYERSRTILRHFLKYGSQQAIGFCASKAHARMMARFFNENGIPSAAVYSGSGSESDTMERSQALEALKNKQLKVLFSVDMFNEGLDIDSIDMVMFLRPTDSSTVFLQQLGRGLRLSPGKQYLNVLDFIGNFDQAFRAPSLLARTSVNELPSGWPNLQHLPLPEGCLADFDLDLIDLFEKLKKTKRSLRTRLEDEYLRIRSQLNHRPDQRELFENMEDDLLVQILKKPSENPFRNYLKFLDQMNDLTADEKSIFHSDAGKFLNMIERTSMSRVYKMPVLKSFLKPDGGLRVQISEKEVLDSWKEFFSVNENWRDLAGKKGEFTWTDYRKMTDREHLQKIRSQPVHFLARSESDFFHLTSDGLLALNETLRPWLDSPVLSHLIQNVLDYRTEYYYYSRFQS